MSEDDSPRLETDRFLLRAIARTDLEQVHPVFESNPAFLALREEVATSAEGYDLTALQRYWEGAMLDPARHLLLVADKGTEAVVGVVDFVDESPADGMPWIGLLLIHRDHQRRGVATAVLRAVGAHLVSAGHSAVRMATDDGNEAGLAFLRSVGCQDYGAASIPTMGEDRRALLLELALPTPDSA